MKFTDRGLKNLKPEDQRYIAWKDSGGGLGLRVSPKGKKTLSVITLMLKMRLRYWNHWWTFTV